MKEGSVLALSRAPEDFDATLGELPAGVRIRRSLRGPVDVVVAFFDRRSQLERRLPALRAAIRLDGGTVIYTLPSVGPLNDSNYVLPGAIRVRASDLKAIVPNLRPGVAVYFY